MEAKNDCTSRFTPRRGNVFVYTLIAVFLGIASLDAQSRNCTAEEKAAADKQLWLSQTDKKIALERQLPWGAPAPKGETSNEMLLIQRDYVIDYDGDLRVPVWTAHRLDGKALGKVERVNCFRSDPRVKASVASAPSDYVEPVFDQGHLTPNSDMSTSINTVINSFVMTNMAPQFCQFNRGVWQIFESIVRLWAKEKGTVYVITGSVFDRNGDGKRDVDTDAKRMKSNNGKTRVAIPTHFYKVLVHQNADGTVDTLAVMLPHDQTDVDGAEAIAYLEKHIVSVDDVEAITGLTFFEGAGAAGADAKHARATTLWPYEGKPARSLVDDRCRKTAGASY